MLTWNQNTVDDRVIFSSDITDTDEKSLRLAFEACAAKAVSLLAVNIDDDSLYLLFEWNPLTSVINIVVTDAQKVKDASQQVTCTFSGLHMGLQHLDANEYAAKSADYTESIQFWLHDYLATCTDFFRFSLVAIF